VPLVWFVAPASVACCLVLMMGLPVESWIRFVVWLVIGMLFYLSYGARRSSSGAELAPADRLHGLAKADRALIGLAGMLLALGLLVAAAIARGSVAADTGHLSEAGVLLALGAPFALIGMRNLRKDS
jgi:C-terminus of AA_permease